MTKGADQTDDAVRNQTCGLGQIVPDVLPDAVGFLVEAATEANEVTGVGEARWRERSAVVASSRPPWGCGARYCDRADGA
jgi:hypothetical protein